MFPSSSNTLWKKEDIKSLSEQDLVDCFTAFYKQVRKKEIELQEKIDRFKN